jgi:hypothetical protein
MSSLHEGDQLLYIGYPMGEGIGGRNYPLSRVGMVSQLVPGRSWYLMDGFVQHGHSGSPVFLVKEQGFGMPPVYDVYLVGIARAYPSEDFTNVYRKVGYTPTDSLYYALNPGFTYVAALDSLLRVLDSMRRRLGK